MKEWFRAQPEGVRIFLQIVIYCVAITLLIAMFLFVMGFTIGLTERIYCALSPSDSATCGRRYY